MTLTGRMNHFLFSLSIMFVGLFGFALGVQAEENEAELLTASEHQHRELQLAVPEAPVSFARFTYDSGYDFPYPEDAVRGIYLTGHSAGGSRFETLLDLVDTTELNSMVIDIKDDDGYLTYKVDEDDPYYDISRNFIGNPTEMMETLEAHEIYPIARVVVFKDSVLAKERPDLSFLEDGDVWVNNRGEAFVNPYEKEVWDYNIEVAKKAAEMGFREIQFDYVRYPEGFERRDEILDYSQGDYEDVEMEGVQKRVEAVTDFVAYAREQLEPYDVDVSVDIFGYAVTVEETPGIGQNFSRISDNVDVISSMIYPSHWTPHFGIDNPDEEPYELVNEYAQLENEILDALDTPPVSRPWLQDFDAPWLYSGEVFRYGVDEVEAQIRALNENGIDEFLLWNAQNTYTEGVDYTPLD
ncbi:hypothetical protein SAMN05421734_10647 [Pelagirhabdus alkalitolerans]|uniref:DUF4015 domain-containing protein n=1 Tax=Pelagirhabdus alkalitolerans TaxID=1612202 RepID=A0A1G6KF19_9BACI|nr:putative glycoside hydrolase [Pelagirhabdus alkalitolerans]SDC28906.1 hypothetical protein SAMN05421734_10647 [Pelagirhabdus alkalitolerans]